ncbi:MAG: hypothetical protein ABSH20_00415 [Tepidisphaeraceae bacterium]
MQKAFSLQSMCFERVPDDSQLVCLLGDRDCGPVNAVEEAGLLIVRPWLIPMKFMVPWVLLTMAMITIVTVCFYRPWDFFLGLFLAVGWFLSVPGLLVAVVVINRSFARKGDYFKVDTARRTLELCQVGRTLKAGEIIGIVLLTRYCNIGSTWHKTFQTGVLFRTRDNRVELLPAVRELGENVPSSKASQWADRLAHTFQVPIRRIGLSRSESRALNDS